MENEKKLFREKLIATRPTQVPSPGVARALMGTPCPDEATEPAAYSAWYAEAEARVIVSRADAILLVAYENESEKERLFDIARAMVKQDRETKK